MNADKLRAALARAQSLAPDLASAADQLNGAFANLEDAMRAADIRVPVSVKLYDEQSQDDPDPLRPLGVTHLAWGKYKGTWSLIVGTDWYSGPPIDDEKLLTAASLADRKIAASKVHDLVAAIADAMEKQVQDLKVASKQVDDVTAVVLGDEA